MQLKLALVQHNFNVGFLAGNTSLIRALHDFAAAATSDLVLFSEMAITGYPPEDLVLSRSFQELSMKAVEELAELTHNGTAMLVGGLWREDGKLYNTAFLLDGGKIIHRQYKHHLPNYGVFDEKRIFTPGPMPEPVEWRGIKLGILICEDMWKADVAEHLKAQGAELFICINASPYETAKAGLREHVATGHTLKTGLPLIYVNQIGGQDDLVFDGGSFAVGANGSICARLHAFKEDLAILECAKYENAWHMAQGRSEPQYGELESIYYAMMLGLKDFVEKNGFLGVVIGISGGIDSTLSAVIAADALGGDRVHMIMLPSHITSRESVEDAMECAKRIGARLDIIPIDEGIKAFESMYKPFAGESFEVISANNHTRIRGSILMAFSAQEKSLLLTTGNKSELATGFMTIYGDMCGHYNVLKDIYKTKQYELAHWRNAQSEVIPKYALERAPSGETMLNITDQDTLPPYDLLDEILFHLVEQQLSQEEVIALGFEVEVVEFVTKALFSAEFKRRQSPPGVKLTSMSFGRDRRYPIASSWRAKRIALH